MKRNAALLGFLLSTAVLVAGIGCTGTDSVVEPGAGIKADSPSLLKVGRGQIWADCELFETVGTPTSFKPGHGKFDELYNGAFKDGVGSISESKPGDQDFNGGRWHVNALKEGVDPAKYSGACSVEELDPNDFESTDTYFECPLLPRRGNH